MAARFDPNTPPTSDEIYLDMPWGGSPVVSSEVGAEPQAMDDPETMEYTAGTCRDPEVSPTQCTPDCMSACRSPMCSLNCLCACKNAQQRAMVVASLREKIVRAPMLAEFERQEEGRGLQGSRMATRLAQYRLREELEQRDA
uniref:Uncharacterized protein n=1 Tax=Hanusia phi TaxID=3032 RepID=A0A7S0DVG4_9CRYP